MKKNKTQLIIGLILITFSTIPVTAYNQADIQWAPNTTATLRIDDTLTVDEYKIKAIEFPSPVEAHVPVGRYEGDVEPYEPVTPFITLNLYKNDKLLKSGITLFMGDESYIYTTPDHEFRIIATDFPDDNAKEWVYEYYDPWATIKIQKRGVPEFTITLETEKDTYNTASYYQFPVTLKLKNTGHADAKNVKLTINTDGLPLKMGKTTENYNELLKDEEVETKITLGIPISLTEKKFNITARATGYDIKTILYTGTGSKTVTITPPPPLTIEKAIPESIYLKDRALLKLIVTNTGNYPLKNITINDSVPDTFKLETDTPLKWTIQHLPVGSEWSKTYALRPVTPSSDGHILPAAHATFTLGKTSYDNESNKPKVIVRGPNITLTKTVSKTTINKGDTTVVTITAKNTGDLPSRTEITDTLPANATLISGELTKTRFLKKDESTSYNYTIQISTIGEITLPKVTASFTDVVYRGTVRSFTNTNSPTINVIDPDSPITTTEQTTNNNNDNANTNTEHTQGTQNSATQQENNENEATPVQTEEYVQPGFEGILSIITLITIYLWRR